MGVNVVPCVVDGVTEGMPSVVSVRAAVSVACAKDRSQYPDYRQRQWKRVDQVPPLQQISY
jgi:hypothetical protein